MLPQKKEKKRGIKSLTKIDSWKIFNIFFFLKSLHLYFKKQLAAILILGLTSRF